MAKSSYCVGMDNRKRLCDCFFSWLYSGSGMMVDEEIKEEEQGAEDSGEGSEPKAATLYERTNEATERLEKANAKTEELLNRQEELYEKQKLGGRAEAGAEAEKPKEDTPKEYAEKVMSGALNKEK